MKLHGFIIEHSRKSVIKRATVYNTGLIAVQCTIFVQSCPVLSQKRLSCPKETTVQSCPTNSLPHCQQLIGKSCLEEVLTAQQPPFSKTENENPIAPSVICFPQASFPIGCPNQRLAQ